MTGSRDTTHRYWNGDGSATERGVHDVHFEDTRAASSTDGGYDLKSTRTTLVRAVAVDNKRNFASRPGHGGDRLHRRPAAPRGGAGGAAQVWLAEQAEVVITGCTLVDGDSSASRRGKWWPTPGGRVGRRPQAAGGSHAGVIVFQLEAQARLTVKDSTLTQRPGSRLKLLESGAHLELPRSLR